MSTKTGCAAQWGIRGHCISMPHEGPEELAERLPDVKSLTGTKVIFAGKKDDLQAIARGKMSRPDSGF